MLRDGGGAFAVVGEECVVAFAGRYVRGKRFERMHFAAAAAGEGQRAEADQREIAARFVEIAPEAQRRHVADADDGVEIAAADHPLAGGDEEMRERGIFAESGERLGVDGGVEF